MTFIKEHREAVVGVIVYIALIVALLLFLGLYKPNPLPPEEGIVMDFGGSGSGSPKPGPATPKPVKTPTNAVSNQTPNQSLMTQTTEETVSVPTNTNITDSQEETENNTTQEETTPEANENVQSISNFNFGATSNSNATGDGEGNPGDGGSGDGGSGGGSGSGSGNIAGNGWELNGRAVKNLPTPTVTNCEGYVIVVIEVDQSGKVINAYAKPGGCTACDNQCLEKAVNSARKASFNADANAQIRQRGTITYNFRPQ